METEEQKRRRQSRAKDYEQKKQLNIAIFNQMLSNKKKRKRRF